MENTAERVYDIIVWGATGFTGKLACEFIAKTYGLPSSTCRYAIAARTESRLNEVEKSMIDTAKLHNKTNGMSSVTKILANVYDDASIDKMTQQATCIVALAGPYGVCGETIIRSCVKNKTHYVDATGEMLWVKEMRAKYSSQAKANNVKIIVGCGGGYFTPNEIAMHFIHEQCNMRKLKMKSVTYDCDIAMAGISGGTLRSLANSLQNVQWSDMYNHQFDPYSYCTTRPSNVVVDANKPKHLSVKFNRSAQQYASESFAARPCGRWMRWSNESQDHVWGKDTVFQTRQLSNSFCKGVVQIAMMWLALFFVAVFSRLMSLIPVIPIPKSGAATFDGSSVSKNKYHNAYCQVEAADSEGLMKVLNFYLTCPHESYWLTGISTVEAALCAAKDKTTSLYGVTGSSGALGKSFSQRMEKHDVTVTFQSIS